MKPILMTAAVLAIALASLVMLKASLYQVEQRDYAIQTRFGKVQAIRLEPGLYAKAPFVDRVQRIDRRTLRADIPPREVPDRDKERLIIDTVIRYRIQDPLQFRKTLKNEATARERLQHIIYSAMRDTIAQHDRTEIIGARARLDDGGKPVSNEEGLPIYDSLVDTRDAIAGEIQERVHLAVTEQEYGIEILSADIKRADFPHQVRSTIIERLKSERRRVAARHRADGEEEYRKRTALVQRDADILIAEARRDARETRGEGDAEAIRIVQESLERDPEFYTFMRTLESYESSVQPGALLVLTRGEAGGYLDLLAGLPDGEDRKTWAKLPE